MDAPTDLVTVFHAEAERLHSTWAHYPQMPGPSPAPVRVGRCGTWSGT
jgi:hypothetical protein